MERRSFLRVSVAGAAAAAFGGAGWLSGFSASAADGDGPYGPLLPADANGVALPVGFTAGSWRGPARRSAAGVRLAPGPGRRRVLRRRGRLDLRRPTARCPPRAASARSGSPPTGPSWTRTASSTARRELRGRPRRRGTPGCPARRSRTGRSTRPTRSAPTRRSCARRWAPSSTRRARRTRTARSIYLTEDLPDGGFYRFTPAAWPDLSAGTLETWSATRTRPTAR